MSGDDFTVDAQDESKICAVQVTSSRWVGQSRGESGPLRQDVVSRTESLLPRTGEGCKAKRLSWKMAPCRPLCVLLKMRVLKQNKQSHCLLSNRFKKTEEDRICKTN